MFMGAKRHTPAALTPEKTCYPLYSKLVWPQGRSGPGFVPRTVQPVASRYNK
jgi:hypothetical protein